MATAQELEIDFHKRGSLKRRLQASQAKSIVEAISNLAEDELFSLRFHMEASLAGSLGASRVGPRKRQPVEIDFHKRPRPKE
jgi:hypothetical protein